MSIALLDVNVLLALAWPHHIHHDAAHAWFADNQGFGWATCPITQLGFVRLSMQPSVAKVPTLLGGAMDALTRITQAAHHRFWPLDYGITAIRDEIRVRVYGHQQTTDALLLDLAIRNNGRFATFDRRISTLLPAESESRSAIVLIPV